MTADKVGELEALLAKATPGEWQSMNEYQWDSIIGDIDGPDDGEMHYESVADITSHHARSRANAALIAAMRNALPELLRIYRAWQVAAVGECSAAGRMELDGDSVCGFFISTSADELRRNPFGQRVRLVPDDGDDHAQGGRGWRSIGRVAARKAPTSFVAGADIASAT